jgi:ABC-type transport system substrate-binding protein
MGEVWRARLEGDLGFAKPVALKILPDGAPHRADALLTEARIGAALKHPNIVDVYEFVVVDGENVLAMELVDGPTVGAMLHANQSGLPHEVAEAIVAQVADGLIHAHQLRDEDGRPAGLVHRDLKPGNLMVARSGVVKIVDFGIAKVSFAARRSQTGEVKGTLHYMSPEQLRGARDVDASADVWALGLIAAELVLGVRLVPDGHPGSIVSWVLHLDTERIAAEVASSSPALGDVVRRALVPDPAARATAAEVRAALRDAAGPEVLAAWLSEAGMVSASAPSLERTSGARSAPEVEATLTMAAATATAEPPAAPPRRGSAAWSLGFGSLVVAVVSLIYASWPAPAAGPTLRVAYPHARADLDPYGFSRTLWDYVDQAVQDPLVRVSDTGAPEPAALASWATEDGHVVLKLRDGLRFHDHPCLPGGADAAPTDVLWSLEVAARAGVLTAVPIRGLDAYVDGAAGSIDGLALAPDGVEVTLDAPFPFLPHRLSTVVLLARATEGCDDPRDPQQPVGTGPYRFDGPALTESLRLVRHDAYGEPVAVDDPSRVPDAIEVVGERDAAVVMSAFARDELDLFVTNRVDGLSDLLPPDARLVGYGRPDERFKALVVLGPSDGPLSDPVLRRHLAVALDRAPVAAAHVPPLTASSRVLRPQWLGYDPTRRPSAPGDEEVAAALAAQPRAIVIGAFASDRAAADALAGSMGALGFTVEIEEIAQASLAQLLRAPTVDAVLVENLARAWGTDPYPFLTELVPSVKRFGLLSRETTERASLIGAEPARTARGLLYADFEQHLLADGAIIPLGWLTEREAGLVVVDRGAVEGIVDWSTGHLLPGARTFRTVQVARDPAARSD